jgi:hypothetical protein
VKASNWIIGILAVICLALIYVHQKPSVEISGEHILQQQIDSLQARNSRLSQTIAHREGEILLLDQENDSLRARDAEVKIKYEVRYEKNRNLPADALAREFERVFTENHVDR